MSPIAVSIRSRESLLKEILNQVWLNHETKVHFVLVGVWNTIFGYLIFVGLDYLFSFFLGLVFLPVCVELFHLDPTVSIAKTLPDTIVHVHEKNRGYGGNQKTCYKIALEQGGDIIIKVHPDYQYTPKLIPAMVSMIGNGLYHCVLESRILGGYAVKGGMPVWKYIPKLFPRLSPHRIFDPEH